MKRFLPFLFLSFSSILTAQDYIPFNLSNASWIEYIAGFTSTEPSSGSSTTAFEFTIQGDSLLADKTYAKVYTRKLWNSTRETVYVNMESVTLIDEKNYDLPLELLGGIRQDTATRKVYFIFWNPELIGGSGVGPLFQVPPSELGFEEFVLYDFSTPVGSSFQIGLREMTLEFVGSTMLDDGSLRKTYQFNGFQMWVEGIGGPLGLFTPMVGDPFEASSGLFCYRENMEAVLSASVTPGIFWASPANNLTDDCRMLITNTSNPFNENRWMASPQPFASSFLLQLEGSLLREGQLQVLDQLGRKIHQQEVQNGTNQINSTNWPAGLYYFTVIDEGQLKASGRLIKTRF